MITYRKALVSDAEELADIRSKLLVECDDIKTEADRVLTEKLNAVYFKKALADESFIAWIAVDEQEIIATSGLVFYDVPPSFNCLNGKVAYIMNMYTIREHRGLGIATELFDKIVGEAKQRGYKKITLNATDIGRPLYEKYGFKDEHGAMVFHIE